MKRDRILIHDIGLHRASFTFIFWSWFCDILDFISIIRIRNILALFDNAQIHWLVIPSFNGRPLNIYKPFSLLLMKLFEKRGDKIITHIHDNILGDEEGRKKLQRFGLHPMKKVIHISWRNCREERFDWINIHFPLFFWRKRKPEFMR